MQTATFTIGQSAKIELWRGIPAEITVKGLASVSGSWIFLVDSDYFDGAILSGTVTASGEDLIITLEQMNTLELANAIKGKSQLICRATLTDSESQIQLIPIVIKNRAVEGNPTPIAEYYTKAQIDAIIAALPTAPVLSVNSKTGNVVLNATDVGALPSNTTASDIGAIPAPSTAGTAGQLLTQTANGPAWANIDWSKDPIASTASISPEAGKVYRHTAAAGDVFTFDTSGLGSRIADFELHLTQPSPPVTVTFPAGIKWEDAGVFSAENDAPDLSEGGRCYILTFRWTGSALLGNLAGEVR